MIQIISLAITAMIAENLLCSKALGLEAALEGRRNYFYFAIFTTLCSVLMSIAAWAFDFLIFSRFHAEFLRLFVYIPSIFIIVHIMGCIPKIGKQLPKFKNALVFNTAILGVSVIAAVKTYSLFYTVLYGFFCGIGYIIALGMLDVIYDKVSANDIPISFAGMPVKLLILAFMSLASLAFVGGVTL